MKTPPPSSFQLHWILAKGPFALRAQLLDGPFSLFSTEPTIRDTPRCQSHSKSLWVVEPVQFSAGIVNHIYGVYHCVVSNSSFSGM